MATETYPSWAKQPSYTLRSAWLSKVNTRRHHAEKLVLEHLAAGEEVPSLLQLELSDEVPRLRHEGWHHFLIVDTFRMCDSFPELQRELKTLLKRSDFGAGPWEMLFPDADAPVRLSKSQRVRLIDRALKAVAAYPFDDDEHHFFELLEPFGDYALALSVEYGSFRRFIEGDFSDADNPLKSLAGQPCRVTALAFESEDGAKPEVLAEGVLILEGNTVRVGDWEHTFDDANEVFESVAYEEVNVASEDLQQSVYFTPLTLESQSDEAAREQPPEESETDGD